MSLEDSIRAFSRGMELKKICEERLAEAEAQIEILEKGKDNKIKSRTIKAGEDGEIPEKNEIQGTLL